MESLKVETYAESVDADIASFPALWRATFLLVAERIESHGLEPDCNPHIEQISDRLWRMQFRGGVGTGRAVFFTVVRRKVVIVLAYAKFGEMRLKSVIALAERRAKEFKR